MANIFNILDGSSGGGGGGGGSLTIEAAQARRTTTQALTTSFADITLDATDVETDGSVVEHDNTNTDRLNLIAAGLYRVWYRIDTDVPSQSNMNAEIQARVRANDAGSGIAGSEARAGAFDDGSLNGRTFNNSIACEFRYVASANDFITLQALKVNIGGTPLVNTRASGVVFGAERIAD